MCCFVIFSGIFTGLGNCADTTPTGQRLICNTGYKVPECLQQLNTLRVILDHYHAEKLGTWTWVLVKSEDWKPIVRRLGGNTDSPAFSVVEKRQTFLEEALFTVEVTRTAELLKVWSLSQEQLLDLAVTHELGHGMCQDTNELRADQFGRLLRQGKQTQCSNRSFGRASP